MDSKRKIIVGVLFFLWFAIGLGIGVGYQAWYYHEHPEVKEIIKYSPVYHEVIKKEYIQVPVKEIMPVEIVKEVSVKVPVNLKRFDSPEDLAKWLNTDTTNELPHKFEIEGIVFELDCDDYAMTLQQNAYKDGYLMNVQIFGEGARLPVKGNVFESAHALNSTLIGNEVWLIEPQTDEHWKAYEVD